MTKIVAYKANYIEVKKFNHANQDALIAKLKEVFKKHTLNAHETKIKLTG